MPELHVHYIDVGQGDSILLDLGETEVLIDGGGRFSGVAAYLEDFVDGSLEAMIATHPHADHIGGLIAVLDAFEVDRIWHNGQQHTTQTYSEFMAKTSVETDETYEARRGGTIEIGALLFRVLHPAHSGSSINNNSIVLYLKYGETEFLFTGDAEKEAEDSTVEAEVLTDIEILKVGHHGSRTSSSQAFLDIVQPEDAIIMVGADNSYNHPHEETISRLKKNGATVWRTDINGTIVVRTKGQDYTVQPKRTPTPAPTPTPTPRPSATPTLTPTSTATVTPTPTPTADLALEIVSVTSHIGRGYTATLWAKTEPGADCTIKVYYKSGLSEAEGLNEKQADSEGNVSWSWKVGTRTTPGSWPIVVTASLGGKTASQTTYITVY